MVRKIILLFVLIFSLVSVSKSQYRTDTIAYKQSIIGNIYTYNGQIMKYKQLKRKVKSRPEAVKPMNRAILNYNITLILAVGGGLLVSNQVEELIYSKKGSSNVDYKYMAIGGMIAASAIPFWYRYNKKSLEAVKIYNSSF